MSDFLNFLYLLIDQTADAWDYILALPYKTVFTVVNCLFEPAAILSLTMWLRRIGKMQDAAELRASRRISVFLLAGYALSVFLYFGVAIVYNIIDGALSAQTGTPDPYFLQPGFHTEGICGIYGFLQHASSGWEHLSSWQAGSLYLLLHAVLEPLLLGGLLVGIIVSSKFGHTVRRLRISKLAECLAVGYAVFWVVYLCGGAL